MGPLQFMVIAFEGNQFNGEILPELEALRNGNVIRLLDLVFVRRDVDGVVSSLEMSDVELQGGVSLSDQTVDILAGDWFAEDDIDRIGRELPDQSSVAMVLVEHLWAKPLQEATRRANGSLITEGMVPRDVITEIEARLQSGA